MLVKMIGWKCSKSSCGGQIMKEVSKKYTFGCTKEIRSPSHKKVWNLMTRFTCAKCNMVHIPNKEGNAGVKV